MITIYVDADACPVKNEIRLAAKPFRTPVIFVASYDHELKQVEDAVTVQVDRSSESVDIYIANHIVSGDIVITQDFGLAALVLGKKAKALSNRGQAYSDSSIDYLLHSRYERGKLRKNGKHSKGPRAFTKEDRNNFLHSLTKLLESLQENH
jgi:uncharacterized protein YaiI (UPF0178 family)